MEDKNITTHDENDCERSAGTAENDGILMSNANKKMEETTKLQPETVDDMCYVSKSILVQIPFYQTT